MSGVSVLRRLRVGEGSPVDEGANQHAVISLTKRRTQTVAEPTEIEKKLQAAEAALAKAKADAATELAKVKADHEAELKKLAPKVEPTQEEIEKALPASVREDLAKSRTERAELAKRLDDEIAKRETAEWVTKAKGYGAIGASPEDLGGLLRKVAKHVTADEMGKLEGVLKAAGEIASKADVLTKTIRKAGGADGSSAEAKIEKRAAEIRKASPDLTREMAYAKALDESPELYSELSSQEA